MSSPTPQDTAKLRDLEEFRERSDSERLTTNQGVRISHTDDSLKAGERGPTLMEDFHFREKLTHFDHERIPERVVHARGSAAHGYFQCYEDLSELTRAQVFRDPSARTPVFVRFSTVVGSRGSADTVRDARGFATKFYTQEGVWDLVGNNMPVFFIQDGIKFPDLVHSIKPEPHNEMPQASAAHDTFWDFISLMPESMHMIMWVLSDRALPRSYAMMEGFGVHTFRFVNEAGKARFVKFHWKPAKPMASLLWDESQKIAGKDPDFNRRDLWEAIERGDYAEFELGVQIVEEQDEHAFDFDLLDPTKFIPEELVPVRRIGKMVLNRNPDNFFAETEQVAFHPGHVVPGIDFTNDPLLQARLFSYLDTQLIRLGGPNFAELPINRPTCPVHNNQRDGYGRQTINQGRTSYSPNALGKGCPMLSPAAMGGYVHYMERVEGQKVRARSESFKDHFSQARLFFQSQSEVEKQHLIAAGQFELGKVENMQVRERVIGLFAQIDERLAREVAQAVGVRVPPLTVPAANPGGTKSSRTVTTSAALSMESQDNKAKATPKGRMIAALLAEGFDEDALAALKKAAQAVGAQVVTVSKTLGELKGSGGKAVSVEKSYMTTGSIVFDGVFVPGGANAAAALKGQGNAIHFLQEAYRHCKPIGASGEGVDVLESTAIRGPTYAAQGGGVRSDQGVVTSLGGPTQDLAAQFLNALAQHRFWERANLDAVPG
jgi:catalase